MHLAEYMILHNLNDDAVADGTGVTRVTISRIRRRKVRPDWYTIKEIQVFTKGAVTANDFVDGEAVQ
jgi:transcriptional regulator with XRE-family HTH domain